MLVGFLVIWAVRIGILAVGFYIHWILGAFLVISLYSFLKEKARRTLTYQVGGTPWWYPFLF